MKIAMLTPYFYPHTGGTEKYVKDLSIALVKRGNEVTVFCCNVPRSAGAPTEEVIEGVKVKRIPAIDLGFMGTPVSTSFKLKLLEGFDIIHSHGPAFSFTKSVGKKTKAPHVVTYHCDTTFTGKFGGVVPIPRIGTKIVGGIGDSLARAAVKKVDAIISTSKSYASSSPVIKDFNYHVVPIGVHYENFDAASQKAGLTEESRRNHQIIFVGRLVANKGVEFLVRAMPEVLKSVPGAHLIICGDGDQKNVLIKLIDKLGIQKAITFYGRVSLDIITHLYSTSGVFVLPSINRLEAFGIVQLEAMACRTPVIVSNIPGVKEVMEVGRSGLLVEKENPGALADAITSIITDPERIKAMGRRGRQLVEQKYNWNTIAGQIEEIYKSLL